MKDTLTTNQAADRLASVYDGSCFTYAGARALVEYLEDLEDECGEEIEFDPIGLCCAFAEYPSLVDWAEEYGFDYAHEIAYEGVEATLDNIEEIICEYIQDRGTLIEFNGGIIVSAF